MVVAVAKLAMVAHSNADLSEFEEVDHSVASPPDERLIQYWRTMFNSLYAADPRSYRIHQEFLYQNRTILATLCAGFDTPILCLEALKALNGRYEFRHNFGVEIDAQKSALAQAMYGSSCGLYLSDVCKLRTGKDTCQRRGERVKIPTDSNEVNMGFPCVDVSSMKSGVRYDAQDAWIVLVHPDVSGNSRMTFGILVVPS